MSRTLRSSTATVWAAPAIARLVRWRQSRRSLAGVHVYPDNAPVILPDRRVHPEADNGVPLARLALQHRAHRRAMGVRVAAPAADREQAEAGQAQAVARPSPRYPERVRAGGDQPHPGHEAEAVEASAPPEPREARPLSGLRAAEEALHRLVQPL